ncbi:MAG TPA: hypothetical protein VNZ55_13045, partial [Thermomicrobiales bacterium]|nr:hypothetical protein [Thermomicrobiales bacterium]
GVSYLVLVGTMIVAGLLSGPVNPLLVTVRFERIPARLRGRVFATFSALASLADPVGMAVTGFYLERRGLERGLIVTAALFTLLVLAIPFVRTFGQMNRIDPPDGADGGLDERRGDVEAFS